MSESQKKRRDLSFKEKLDVLDRYSKLPKMSQRNAASQLGVSQTLLCKILKNTDSIVSLSKRNRNLDSKRNRSGKDPQVESALKLWFQKARQTDARIDGALIRQKAEDFAKEIGKQDFKATDGWFNRWKKRENIVYKKTCESKDLSMGNISHTVSENFRKPNNDEQNTMYPIGDIKVEPLEVVNDVDDGEDPIDDPLFCYNTSNLAATRINYESNKETDVKSLSFDKPSANTLNGHNDEGFTKNYIDEDKTFVLSILPMMKELNGEQKMEFKMCILDYLRKLRYPNSESSNKFRVVNIQNFTDGQRTPKQQSPPPIQIACNDKTNPTPSNTNAKAAPKPRKAKVQRAPKRTTNKRQQELGTTTDLTTEMQKLDQPQLTLQGQQAVITQPVVLMCVTATDQQTITPSSGVVGDPAQTPSGTTPRVYKSAKRKSHETSPKEVAKRGTKRTTTTLKSRLASVLDNETELTNMTLDTPDSPTDPLEIEMDFEEVKLECVKEEPPTKDADY